MALRIFLWVALKPTAGEDASKGRWGISQKHVFFPFLEPSVSEYFMPLRNHTGEPRTGEWYDPATALRTVPTLKSPSWQDVAELTLHGQPFLIRRENPDWSFRNFSCADFQKRWPGGDARDEFDHEARVRIGDETWHKSPRRVERSPALHMARGEPTTAPVVWHVKDETPPWMKKEMQEHWKSPNWAFEVAPNAEEMAESFELWFSPPGGAAVFAHADSYCEPTASLQIRGVKRWRLMMYPSGSSFEDRFDSFDEGIYSVVDAKVASGLASEKASKSADDFYARLHRKFLWKPEYDFEVESGETFVFPPNYMHETWLEPLKARSKVDGQIRIVSVDEDENIIREARAQRKVASLSKEENAGDVVAEQGCAIAATFQYILPFPTRYYRAFLPRMVNSRLGYY